MRRGMGEEERGEGGEERKDQRIREGGKAWGGRTGEEPREEAAGGWQPLQFQAGRLGGLSNCYQYSDFVSPTLPS